MIGREPNTRFNALRLVARYTLALAAGGAFAYFAWEPRPVANDGSHDSQVNASGVFTAGLDSAATLDHSRALDGKRPESTAPNDRKPAMSDWAAKGIQGSTAVAADGSDGDNSDGHPSRGPP